MQRLSLRHSPFHPMDHLHHLSAQALLWHRQHHSCALTKMHISHCIAINCTKNNFEPHHPSASPAQKLNLAQEVSSGVLCLLPLHDLDCHQRRLLPHSLVDLQVLVKSVAATQSYGPAADSEIESCCALSRGASM